MPNTQRGKASKIQEKGKTRMTKELTQMHDMNVFRPIKKNSLTKEERAKVLALLMCLKQILDKIVKARMCVDR